MNSIMDSDDLLRTLVARGVAYLGAAEGPDAIKPDAITPKLQQYLEEQHIASHSVPPPQLRDAAVQYFREATCLVPDQAWLWFQIGWNLFAFEDGPTDLPAAREALDKAYKLAAKNPIIHLALAWLTLKEMELGTARDELRRELPTREAICQQVRDGLACGAAGRHNLHLALPGPKMEEVSQYFPTVGGNKAMRRCLEQLDPFVPDNFRFTFSVICSHHIEDIDLKKQWLQEALRWEPTNIGELIETHMQLGNVDWQFEIAQVCFCKLAGVLSVL
jgi:hypothetical protein